MLKQSPTRMKKVLVILLVVLFVASLTAVTASAARHSGHRGGGHHGGGHHGGGHHGGGHHGGGHHGSSWGWGNDHSHRHWWHGQYYPNCDWILNPYTNQWVWTC